MVKQLTFRSTWLPLGLAVLALVVLNWGLYARLSAQPVAPRFTFPYSEDFTTITDMPYESFGGDWEIRDQALVQLNTTGFDLTTFVPIEIAADQSYRFSATVRYLGGTMGGGLTFNAQQLTSRQQSHMARLNMDGGQIWLIYGYFGEDSNFVGQGSVPLNIAPDDQNPHRLSVEVGAETYALSVDGAVAAGSIPLMYHGGAVGFVSAASQVSFDDIVVESVGDTQTASAAAEAPTAVPAQAATPVPTTQTVPVVQGTPASMTNTVFSDSFDQTTAIGESQWRPISGSWAFDNGSLVQSQAEGFDLSAIYQQPLTQPYTLRATFQHRQGSGGGVLFNLPAPDSSRGGEMVRYVDDGTFVAWGYFDANGVFNGQGSTGVTAPGQSVHTLEIVAQNGTFDISLDGVSLVTGVPINNPVSQGYIGLTASQSVAAFDEVNVFTPANQPPAEVATADINADAAIGTWIVDGGVITQSDTEMTDYVAGTGLAGEQFTVSVNILLPPDVPDAGAGVIFHMQGRDDRGSGHMVRFGSGGREILWGNYDANGVFVGEGGVGLELPTGEPSSLMLVVREGSYDIQVNGAAVVTDIPIEPGGGWIGLLSFSGPVEFSNVSVQLGQ